MATAPAPEVLVKALDSIVGDAPPERKGAEQPGGRREEHAGKEAESQEAAAPAAAQANPNVPDAKQPAEQKAAEPKEKRGKPTPEQLRHYAELTSRERRIENKSQALTERERAIAEREKVAEGKATELDQLIRQLYDGDLDTKSRILTSRLGVPIDQFYKHISETAIAAQSEHKSDADIAKLVSDAVKAQLEPLVKAKEQDEKEAAERTRQQQAEQADYHVASELGRFCADAEGFPEIAALVQVAGDEGALEWLWGLGKEMRRLGKADPKTYRMQANMTPETAPPLIAAAAERFFRTARGKEELAAIAKRNGKQLTQPEAGLRTNNPATSLAAGQAQLRGTGTRPVTDEERETFHERFDPGAILAELSDGRFSIPKQ